MPSEYQPVTSIIESRAKLKRIAAIYVEIPDQLLFEGVCDVLSSRAGSSWKNLERLVLDGSALLPMDVGYRAESAGDPEHVFLETAEPYGGKTKGRYRVIRQPGIGENPDIFELQSATGEEFEAVSNQGYLASARLYSLLAHTHTSTVRQHLKPSDFLT